MLWAAAATAYASSPGSLDTTYGTQGVVLSAVGEQGALAVALQSDEKLLTATLDDAAGDRASLRISRLTTAGALDPAFGNAGVASVAVNVDALSVVHAMLRQANDGRIVVAGRSVSAFSVVRLTNAGAFDGGFGSGGIANTPVSGDDEAFAIAQQADNKLVAAGRADDGIDSDFAVVRYTTAGVPDSQFSGDGIATIEFGGNDVARAIAVQNDGAIVVAGTSEGSKSNIALARLASTGSLDSSFGTGGKVTTSITARDDAAYAVLVQTDGRIVVAGEADDDFVLVRYLSNGQLDSAFGSGGVARTDVAPGHADGARALVRQSDDKLVAAGVASSGRAGDFAIVRYTKTGTPDSAFGSGGIVMTSAAETFDEELTALALQSDGNLLAAGLSEDGSTSYQMVSRYVTGTAAAICGNGVTDAGEQCDDGNTTSGDGCSATCTIEAACGDADLSGKVQASDALRILRHAVGQPVPCPMFVCDVNANGVVQASDALKVLNKAVGLPVTLVCPPPQ